MSSPKSGTFKPLALYFFLICGGYAVDVSSYLLLVGSGANLYVACAASFLVGTACNVVLLRRYFAASRHTFGKDLRLSLVSNGSLFLLMLGMYFLLMRFLGIPHLAAKILSNGVSFVLNYLTRRIYF